MRRVLILCTANICRSPIAQGLLSAHLAHMGYVDWQVSSGGTWAVDGRPAAEFSLQVLAEHGIDLAGHLSRAVTRDMLAHAHLVLVMERGHKEAMQVEFEQYAHKIFLISEMVGSTFDIADPIGSPIEEYRYTFDELDDLLRRGLPRIVELAEGTAP